MSDSFLNVQKFLNKINTGYSNQQKISAARRQNLPDYVAESTLILLQDMVDTVSKNEKILKKMNNFLKLFFYLARTSFFSAC